MQRAKAEIEYLKGQVSKSQSLLNRYEHQMQLFDEESRQSASRIRQMELEVAGAQKRVAEANATVQQLRDEISAMDAELRAKTETIRRFSADIHHSTADVEVVVKQMQGMQAALKAAEEDREVLRQERDALKRQLDHAASSLASSSPRKSLDLLESKLMKELGMTTKKVNDMERQSTLSQSEREHLQSSARKLTLECQMAQSTLVKLAGKLREALQQGGEGQQSSSSEVCNLTQVNLSSHVAFRARFCCF